MLDTFEVLTTSGVVLWSKHYAPVGVNVINSLIKDVFIENSITSATATTYDTSASRNPPYRKDKYTLKWTTARDLGLIFVAVYQSLIHLSWIDELLDNIKTLFTTLYRDQFKKPNTSVVECQFDDYFDRQIRELEKKSVNTTVPAADLIPATDFTPSSSSIGDDKGVSHRPPSPPVPGFLRTRQKHVEDDTTSTEITPIPTPESSRPATPASEVLTAKNGPRTSRRARKAAASVTSAPSSRDASTSNKKKDTLKALKKPRVWGDDGLMDEGETGNLDYSEATGDTSARDGLNSAEVDEISRTPYGKRTGKGEVVLKDLDEEMDSILSSARTAQANNGSTLSKGIFGSGIGKVTSLFQNTIGGATLTHENLAKPLKGLEDHLISKNVAREAAVRLCELVEQDLVGTKTASFQSIDTTIRAAMERALAKILTPTSSLDLLRSIQSVNSASGGGRRRPYVMSIVGVNGVGKSTTLSKLAFLLLHNNLRVLVCAADTFRSGAVEQLAVHVRNLQQLTARSPGEMGHIELYSSGYGKDAALVAQKAVEHAQGEDFDVVLIDTAGRRHNDTKLMSSLERFAQLARPDKILMVGEALVGTDSVAQARHFNASFGASRKLDGFVVSKCDTVGEMVGTLVSLVFATGVPIVAVGVGQHYGDLRGFNVPWATGLLMS